MGAGAGLAALKVWPERKDKFAYRLILALHAPMINALMAIVIIFMARGVTLTWKFTTTWFAASLLANLAVLPLILLLIKGLKSSTNGTSVEASGELPPEFLRRELREAIRQTIKDEFLKP